MSTGTARIIIEQEVSQAIKEKLNIDQEKNKGRHYMAKIVRPIEAHNGCWLISKQGVCKWLGAEQMERAVGMLFFSVH